MPACCAAVAVRRGSPKNSACIASTPLGPRFDSAERELIHDLAHIADTAMYTAKRAGGNQSRSTHLPRCHSDE